MTSMLTAFVIHQVEPPVDVEEACGRAWAEQSAGNYAKAIELYQRILATPMPSDRETLIKRHLSWRQAHRQLPICLEAASRYADALAFYQKAEASPLGSSCGNAITEFKVWAQMGQGRSLESLGRHKEAVEAYFKAAKDRLNGVNFAAVWRIVELYEAAGLTEVLINHLDRRDQEVLANLKPEQRAKIDDHSNPNVHIRRLIEARKAGRQENWGALVDLLGLVHLRGPRSSLPNVVAAAHLLAARPEVTVPLLQAKLDAEPKNGRSWLHYSLGIGGTTEAVKTLKERALLLMRQKFTEEVNWELQDIYFALDFSESGRAVLMEFSASQIEHVQATVPGFIKKSVPQIPAWYGVFPPIPKDLWLN